MTVTLVVIHSQHFFVSWLLKLELPKEMLSAVHSTVSLRKKQIFKSFSHKISFEGHFLP